MADIEVRIAGEEELKKWDEIVDSSPQGTIFHKLDWLKVAEEHTKSKLYPLIGYKGDRVIGLFPIFYTKKPFLKMIFSPPPQCAIPYMGPIFINYENLKQSKKEDRINGLINETFNYITNFLRLKNNFFYTILSPELNDARPFIWNGFTVNPKYDYNIPLNQFKSIDNILKSFKKILRKNIKNCEKNNLIFKEDSPNKNLDDILKSLNKRYIEQNKKFRLIPQYLDDIIRLFYRNIKYFAVEYLSEKVAELLCIEYKDSLFIWIGGYSKTIKSNQGYLYPNDYLHWKVIEYAYSHNKRSLKIIGADIKQLCKFKAKFNPDLELTFVCEKADFISTLAKRIYLGQ